MNMNMNTVHFSPDVIRSAVLAIRDSGIPGGDYSASFKAAAHCDEGFIYADAVGSERLIVACAEIEERDKLQ